MLGKALIIDDAKVVRTSLGRIIKRLGYEVLESENGEVALKTFDANPEIKLLFLDINMPVMNGMEFLEKFRKEHPMGSGPPVIIVSTETETSSILKALSLGADEYIMKPFDEGVIRGKLDIVGIEHRV